MTKAFSDKVLVCSYEYIGYKKLWGIPWNIILYSLWLVTFTTKLPERPQY